MQVASAAAIAPDPTVAHGLTVETITERVMVPAYRPSASRQRRNDVAAVNDRAYASISRTSVSRKACSADGDQPTTSTP